MRLPPATHLVVHCKSRRQAEYVRAAIAARMGEVGLRIHPDKTRIVYCKDGRRRGDHEHTSFTFLGFTFRARGARGTKSGRAFTGFLPAMSTEALKAKSDRLRRMRIHRRTDLTLDDLAELAEPHHRRVDELLRPVLPDRDGSPPKARQYLHEALGRQEVQAAADPQAVHAVVGRAARKRTRPVRPLASRPLLLLRAGEKSPVTGDCHAGICGSPGVRFPRATRLRPRQERHSRRPALPQHPAEQRWGP